MFDEITVIGAGRAGTTIAARLRERGIRLGENGELRLLCVPDRAIAEVARSIEPGPWVAHVSRGDAARGARPARAALLGASAADALEGRRARAARRRLGRRDRRDRRRRARAGYGSPRPSACARSCSPTIARALYHAGASIASNFLVTLYRVAADLVERAGAPPEALVPLMERTIANGFQLTGPIARGDWSTVDRAPRGAHDTDYAELYDALAEATRP